MIFRTSKLWLKSIQAYWYFTYLKRNVSGKSQIPKHQDYVEIMPPFFELTTKICIPFLGDVLSSLFVHSYQTRFFLMSGIWYLRFVFVCLWRKIVKNKQQDANCLQIYSTGLILLAKLCFSWNDLIHHLSDYLPPLPMGTCTNHVDQKTKCEGPFLPFLRGSSLGLHDHKKVRGSNIYYEMLNHGERGALFDLWGCAIVPYNPQ